MQMNGPRACLSAPQFAAELHEAADEYPNPHDHLYNREGEKDVFGRREVREHLRILQLANFARAYIARNLAEHRYGVGLFFEGAEAVSAVTDVDTSSAPRFHACWMPRYFGETKHKRANMLVFHHPHTRDGVESAFRHGFVRKPAVIVELKVWRVIHAHNLLPDIEFMCAHALTRSSFHSLEPI
jgi:hypothetical protein